MKENYATLNVEEVTFDTDNPRIKMALEKYGEQLSAERIHFALRSATDGAGNAASYGQLRDSIRASRGAMDPITVTTGDSGYVCIDGNTRLAIYKQFIREDVEGPWATIRARVLDGADQRDIETIRVAAHLVGAREWPAYEKARYLHYLRNQRFMEYAEMIALCGGNKTDIERQIDAYHDMNEYYRDVVDDTAFHIDRFSGFVELQKPKIKDAIFDADLELKDFGEWIRDGKIFRLADVRKLPRVLGDDDARRVFLEGGFRSIEAAVQLLEQRPPTKPGNLASETTLEAASVYQLAEVLARRINSLPFAEVRALRRKEHEDAQEQVRILEDLSECLNNLLEDVSE